MNNLTIINKNGQLVTDSREVAEMIGKRHDHLVRDIDGYIQILENPKLGNGLNIKVTDFFIKDKYQPEEGGRKYPCYLITKKGCDMVANKMTGEKGVLFTAIYVTKFDEMERKLKQPQKQIVSSEDKQKLAEARIRNAKAREANILLKIANSQDLRKEYKQVLFSHATAIIAGKPLLPLPEVGQTTLAAEEVGARLGISANMVGRIAKANNLKTEQYGKWYHDKSRYSSKEVESFRYYESIVPVMKAILNSGEVN